MILAIDIGTTFLKSAVIDFSGNIEFIKRHHSIISENSPEIWAESLKELITSFPYKLLKSVTAVAISGNGPTLIPVGRDGKPVYNALLWADNRALSLVDEISRKLGTFTPANFFLSKAYWFKKEKPDLYKRTEYMFSCPEYISYLLTGKVYTLLPQAGFMDFYWSDDKLERLELDSNKFPPYISPYKEYGTLLSDTLLPGVNRGIPVICTGPDYLMSILGTGSVKEGIVCDRTGTSEGINYCTSSYMEIDGLRTLPHIAEGLYTVAGLIPDSGQWAICGRSDLIIECYRDIINKMLKNRLKIDEIRVIGGHVSIEEINRLKADSFDIPLKVYSEGSDLIGNAVLASVVTGVYPNLEEACFYMVREELCFNV